MSWPEITWLSVLTIGVMFAILGSRDIYIHPDYQNNIHQLHKRLEGLEQQFPPTYSVVPVFYTSPYGPMRSSGSKPLGWCVKRVRLGETSYTEKFLTEEEAKAVLKVPQVVCHWYSEKAHYGL